MARIRVQPRRRETVCARAGHLPPTSQRTPLGRVWYLGEWLAFFYRRTSGWFPLTPCFLAPACKSSRRGGPGYGLAGAVGLTLSRSTMADARSSHYGEQALTVEVQRDSNVCHASSSDAHGQTSPSAGLSGASLLPPAASWALPRLFPPTCTRCSYLHGDDCVCLSGPSSP